MNQELVEKCRGCIYCKLVRAYPHFAFYGCFCAPNKGKWIIELSECPKLNEDEND